MFGKREYKRAKVKSLKKSNRKINAVNTRTIPRGGVRL